MTARTLAGLGYILLLLTALLAACGSQPVTQNAGLSTTQNPTATLAIEPQSSSGNGTSDLVPVNPGYKDLTVRPQIWFGPLDPWSWDRYYPGQGPFEFYDLFQPDAPWPRASEAVQVVRLYPVWIDNYATPQQLQNVIEDIQARGMAISYEAGPLQETSQCNASTIEGFWGKPGAENIAHNIKAAGGRLYSMDLEHGFDAATYYDVACRKSPREIAEDAAITINALRAIFPDVLIGSIETADLNVDDVAAWMEAYREVMGEELDYFHLDINFQRVDWAERAREIEDYVESRGVEFGIIYFGNHDDGSDIDWINHAESRFVEYEVLQGGTPDHVVFQSWHTHPQNLIPETEPDAFTNLILRYLRPRTNISVEILGNAASGNLQTNSGAPVPEAEIEIFAEPLDGDGLVTEYHVSGTVPDSAVRGNVGFRVNTECDCRGTAAFVLEQVSYTESNLPGGKVPNGSFGNGLNGWGLWGSGNQNLVSSAYGNGTALAVDASLGQNAGANSEAFVVTPGETFTVTFTARVSPLTHAAGYFSLFFLNGATEVARFTLPISAGRTTIATGVTDQDGTFSINLDQLPEGSYQFGAWYSGSPALWPAIEIFK